MKRVGIILAGAIILAGCGTTSGPSQTHVATRGSSQNQTTALPDRVAFLQTDPRWAREKLGKTRSDTMGSHGCLVTATAMALANLGFATDPSDLNKRLTSTNSFTPRGWLVWSGIGKVTGGRAKAHFYDRVDHATIAGCMQRGDYPLVRFKLPNGRTHWAMVVDVSPKGYHMRDPLRPSKSPLIFPNRADKFEAVRCIGLA